MKQDSHSHKCKMCGTEYKHSTQDNSCKEPHVTTCGVCKKEGK